MMDFSENVRLALRSIRGNLLRAILTLLIISFGIMALVGILTAIDSAIYSLNDNFSYLGANSFDIDPKFSQGVRSNRGGAAPSRPSRLVTAWSWILKNNSSFQGVPQFP